MKLVAGAALGAAVVTAGALTFMSGPDPEISQLPESLSVQKPSEPVREFAPIPMVSMAHAATPEPAEDIVLASVIEPMGEDEAGREPVLCAFWFIQHLAEEAGILEENEQRIAEVAYPVPAPVWVVNSLIGLGEQLGT